jgi:uncharacterized protein involved in response to NO
MGGLGVGVMAVFSIAGLLHTSHALRFPPPAKVAVALLIGAVALRVLPDLAPAVPLPVGHYGASSVVWALAFGVWLKAYWPLFRDATTTGRHGC